MPPRRIFVRGTSGSGKSTLARKIAEKLDLEYIEMDAIHHQPNWTERPREETAAILDEVTKRENWVVDGNYSFALDHHVDRADMVVWLDYSFPFVFGRLLLRTLRRGIKKEVLWAGNRETLTKAFFSKDSILWWMITTHHRRRRQCLEMKKALKDRPGNFVHLTSPLQTDLWLISLDKRSADS